MPIDTFKPKGPAKHNKPDSGGGGSKQYPILGIVKDNIDPTRSGRIRVALQDGKGGTNPDSASSWVTVQHLTTFFGVVRPTSGSDSEDYGTYKNNPSSYGQWQAPPDIGTKVVCIFINGDINAGYYIGCVPEAETLQMVPAIGASDVVTVNGEEAKGFGGATRLPVTNLNTNNKDKADSNEFLDTPRPVHSYTASIMSQQGIIRDPVRGPISSSASREPASRVGWGVATPGRPIYEGGFDDENLPENLTPEKAQELKIISRRGGHSIVMDDGDIIGRDQLVRIRTSLGHQILMSDDGQTLSILHSNGQSYIELGKEGTVDVYSTNSINMRTSGDFNIHADRNVNIHAMENLNLQGKNIHTNSEETTQSKAGNYNIESLKNFTVKAAKAFAAKADGQASMVAGGQAFVNGIKVNLNSGFPSTSPKKVPFIPLVAQTDTLFDETKGWAAAPGKLLTTVSRAPAHLPWANAGMGVAIKTSGNASDNLPRPSSSIVQKVNNLAGNSGITAPNVATVASVPTTKEVSDTMDKVTTGSVLGAIATSAATVVTTAKAVVNGAAIIPTSVGGKDSGLIGALNKASTTLNTAGSDVIGGGEGSNGLIGGSGNDVLSDQASTSVNQTAVAVGSFAQSPKQLEQSKVLKPGSGVLINGLASAGKSVSDALPEQLFTGKPGAENVSRLIKNTAAQAESVVDGMQAGQKALIKAGLLTGKESNTQTAGLVAATSVAGVKQTIDTAKESAGTTPPPANGSNPANMLGKVGSTATQVSGGLDKAGPVMNTIGLGNEAAKLADVLGGLGGIANALKGMGKIGSNRVTLEGLMNSVKGVVGSAYSAIIDSFPDLEPNVPQYLTDFAKQSATKAAVESNTVPGEDGKNTDATKTDATASANTTKSTNGQLKGVSDTGAKNTINNTVAGVTGATKNTDNTVTEGTSPQQPNKKPTVNLSNALDSIEKITNVTGDLSTVGATSKLIGKVTGANSGATKLLTNVNRAINDVNALAGATQSLKNGADGLKNAAKSVQAGGNASKASLLASGVNSVPGGIKAVSNVVDQVSIISNIIPGTELLSGKMRNTVTDVQNGLAKAGRILNDVDSIAKSLGGISGSISSKLPLGEASQLLSSLAGLGSGGGRPIKLPQMGVNTLNRGQLTAQVNRLINDLGIPKPKFLGEVLPDVVQTFEQIALLAKQQRKLLQQRVDAAIAEEKIAKQAYIDADNNLPAGDPNIETLRKKYIKAKTKVADLLEDLNDMDRKKEKVVLVSTVDTTLPTPTVEIALPELTIPTPDAGT